MPHFLIIFLKKNNYYTKIICMSKTDELIIAKPKNGTKKEELLKMLIDGLQKTKSEEDIEKVKKAYEIANRLHTNQKRRSGEEYIIHPICVAMILVNLNMDIDTIIAGILHDTVEDTGYTIDDVKKDFSETIANIVEGVTKLTQLNLSNDKVLMQAENLRHMFLAMSKDIRVIIVKLADRLHNLRTLEYQSREKQEEKSLETLEIYSPIANRLGISKVKTEMDDLALSYLKPKEYKELQTSIKIRKERRESFIEKIVSFVSEKLKEADIQAEVYGRVKNLFSIYKKMHNKNKTIDEIYDLFAIRILVNDVKDCYASLGIIHEYYTPIPGRFKDYIAMPKPNNYKSLHTTVFGKDSIPFEIQIRTYEMHEIAEYGIAAHWAYKENGNSEGVKSQTELEKMNWLKDILEANITENNSQDFINYVKSDLDLFTEKVYCFTPQGDVKTLPKGSTPIDFAYMIHSAVGNKMVGAKVNDILVPIDYEIQNGDRISILTSGNSQGPSRDWLKIVKSPQAKNKIMHWFKHERRDENIVIGKELVDRYIKSKKYKAEDLFKNEYIELACKKYTCPTLDDIYASIGHGGLKESQFVSKLKEEYDKDHKEEVTNDDILKNYEKNNSSHSDVSKGGIIVKGIDDLAVRYARCCSPVPGDEIVGFVTRGKGITIHRTDCKNMLNLPEIEKNRLIEAEWNDVGEDRNYHILINIFCDNRKGLLSEITKIFTENNINIESIESRTLKNDKFSMTFGFNIKDKEELYNVKKKIMNVQGVNDIERI